MKNPLKILTTLLAISTLISPAFAEETKAQKQTEVRNMCKQTLATLYKAKPTLKARVEKAAGFGCFSSFGITFLVGGAGGSGLVHDNVAKTNTFMNMGQASAGVEVGIKDYREVLVFHNKATMQKFIDSGWEFTGNAEATAQAGSAGAQEEKAGSGTKDIIDIYPLTKNGLAIGASVGERKYWKSDDLN